MLELCVAADEAIFNGPLGKMMGALSGGEEYGHMANEMQANLAAVIERQDPQALGRLHMEVCLCRRCLSRQSKAQVQHPDKVTATCV